MQEVNDARDELAVLTARNAELAERVGQQQNEIDRITAELDTMREQVDRLRDRVDAISAQLSDRAAEAYMLGPGSVLGSLLTSSSIQELSDRIEYVDAAAQADASLAAEVSGARVLLGYRVKDMQALETQERQVLDRMEADQAALQADFDRRSALLREIEDKERRAAAYADQLGDERQEYLDALLPPPSTGGGGGSVPSGVFRACPVDQPHVLTDSFGAPRYVGGYHPHEGVDIMAPGGTPVRAPFDGVARDATNEIGGIAVIVQGASGWVYNAHLSARGQLGNVGAGDVIGYVGMTGTAGAGVNHNHFEYHPSSMPSSWPASVYGYSTIDDAVNPYPLLSAVC